MADLEDAPLRDVPFRITHPERIPKERYFDEEFFRLEKEHFWPRVWQMACRLEEIPEVGDWIEYTILDDSIIVVRAETGVKAFHNSCRHRGMRLVNGQGNCQGGGFVCPFHGWRWNIEGKNKLVWGRQVFSEEALDSAELDLVPCRVEIWGGAAFINMDDKAAPLLDHIGPLAERLNPHNVDKLQYEWWYASVLPVNWKLAMEAFMEGMHVMRTHPQLHKASIGSDKYAPPDAPAPRAVADSKDLIERLVHMYGVLSEGMGGMVHANDVAIMRELKDQVELPDDPRAALMEFQRVVNDEITRRGRARRVPMPDLNELARHPDPLRRYVFPNHFLLTQFGNMASYRIRPLTPETCLFELASLILYPEDEKRPRPSMPDPIPADDPRYPPISQQDYSNLPEQQIGLHSSSFKYMRLSRTIEGLISNYQRLLDGYLLGIEEEKLAAASRIASAGLDWPIEDIGFGPTPQEVVAGERFTTVQKLR